MKHILIILPFMMTMHNVLLSQPKSYNVVFDITSSDTAVHHRVIRWVNSITSTYPDAKVEIVFYGKSLPMVEKEKSTVAQDVQRLATSNKVAFVVCEQAMKTHSVDKNKLLDGVKTVPDALYELVSKQAEGYGYIKVTN